MAKRNTSINQIILINIFNRMLNQDQNAPEFYSVQDMASAYLETDGLADHHKVAPGTLVSAIVTLCINRGMKPGDTLPKIERPKATKERSASSGTGRTGRVSNLEKSNLTEEFIQEVFDGIADEDLTLRNFHTKVVDRLMDEGRYNDALTVKEGNLRKYYDSRITEINETQGLPVLQDVFNSENFEIFEDFLKAARAELKVRAPRTKMRKEEDLLPFYNSKMAERESMEVPSEESEVSEFVSDETPTQRKGKKSLVTA